MTKLIIPMMLVAVIVAATTGSASAYPSLEERAPVCCKVGAWIQHRLEAQVLGLLTQVALPEHPDTRWLTPPAGAWQLFSAIRSAISMLVQITRLTVFVWLRRYLPAWSRA
jgi:hypothetical protein